MIIKLPDYASYSDVNKFPVEDNMAFREGKGGISKGVREFLLKRYPNSHILVGSGRYCGNEDCCVSTGICGAITFGWGELSDNGYWEHPCVICAAVSQRFSPNLGDGVWPQPGEHAIPDWAGQATPGAQLTCLRSAMEGHLSNLKDGITSPEKTIETLTLLLDGYCKPLEQHLQHKSW